MITTALHIIPLEQESDVGLLTQAVREACLSNRFDRVDTEQIVLASSEMGHNAIRHGNGGHAEIFELNSGKLIRVVISDSGPGIPNIELASREGYSTVKTSLGLGLEGAQRLVDNFKIVSEIGQGTKVTLEKYRPLSKESVDYGLVSIPDNNYNYNGDQYVLKEYDGDSLLIGVIDGPGQGYDAHSIAQTCKQFVENNYRKPLSELLTALNTLMKESNDDVGITCSLARISPQELCYLGLGDTHAYITIDDQPLIHLSNQQGRVGHVRKVKTDMTTYSFKKELTVIICSDGLKTIYEPIPKNIHAQDLANNLFDQYHRPSGDATILIAKYKK
ncbi:MAG: ATP-binding protein [Saprospiraceae bacterium]|nr:ATP-binding protein [Saprospiraceae bacterium]